MQTIQITNQRFLQIKKSNAAQFEVCAKKQIKMGSIIKVKSYTTNECCYFDVLMILKMGFETQTLFLRKSDEKINA